MEDRGRIKVEEEGVVEGVRATGAEGKERVGVVEGEGREGEGEIRREEREQRKEKEKEEEEETNLERVVKYYVCARPECRFRTENEAEAKRHERVRKGHYYEIQYILKSKIRLY